MKKLLMSVVVASLVAGGVNAYAGSHGKYGKYDMHDPAKKTERMARKLDLSDAQKEKVETIFSDAKTQIEALDKKYNMDAYRAEKHVIRSSSKSKIDDVLNEEQKAKLEKMRAKHQKKKGMHKGKGGSDKK